MITRNATRKNLSDPLLAPILNNIFFESSSVLKGIRILSSGLWKKVTEAFIIVSGQWKKVNEIQIINTSVWKNLND